MVAIAWFLWHLAVVGVVVAAWLLQHGGCRWWVQLGGHGMAVVGMAVAAVVPVVATAWLWWLQLGHGGCSQGMVAMAWLWWLQHGCGGHGHGCGGHGHGMVVVAWLWWV